MQAELNEATAKDTDESSHISFRYTILGNSVLNAMSMRPTAPMFVVLFQGVPG